MNTQTSTAGRTAIVTFDYEGTPVSFSKGEGIMINANEMAKPFGKRATHWLNNQSTKAFLKELGGVRNLTASELVQVVNGDNGGTWMHEDVAMEFARWLSPKFAIWTNDRIKELLKEGVTVASDDDEVIAHAMDVLSRRLEEKKRQLQIAESTIEAQTLQLQDQQREIATLTPMADYTRDVLQSTSTFTLTQVSKDLNLRSVYILINFCRDKGILYKQSGQWMPTSKFSGKGFFETRTAKYVKADNTIGTSLSTVVTEKGRVFLRSMMEKGGAA